MGTPATPVWRDGFADWLPAGQVPELQPGAQPQGPPPVTGKEAHEIDYTIFGVEMQFVEIELDPQESVIAEAGAMMHMHDQVVMQTLFGDGSRAGAAGSFLDKMIGAGKRLVTGEGTVHHPVHLHRCEQGAGGLCRALPGQDHPA